MFVVVVVGGGVILGEGMSFVCLFQFSFFFLFLFLPSPASMISFDIHGKVFPVSTQKTL